MSRGPEKRKSWKQTRPPTAAQGPNKPLRWLLTLLTIILFAILLPVLRDLFWNRTMPTRLVHIQSGQSRSGVASLVHAATDLRALSEVDWPYYDFEDRSALLQSSQSRSTLNPVDVDDQGALIFYISAHGVTNVTANGDAVVLCRDYELAAPEEGVFEITRWFELATSSQAGSKLLVFDTGSIVSDPRLGMFVNDFPRRVVQAAEQWNDPNLWVLISNKTYQTPLIAGDHDRSLFGTAFSEGLLGKADQSIRGGNDDHDVTLDELYRYLLARCELVSGGLQKPLLVNAGRRLNDLIEIPSLPLLAISVAEQAEEDTGTEASQDAETGPAGAAQAAAQVETPPSSSAAPTEATAQSAGSDRPESAKSSADEEPPDGLAEPDDLLARAWRIRDQIESVPVREGWVPQEYAPHLWRQLLAFLVGLDTRRATTDDVGEISLSESVAGLDRLRMAQQSPEQPGRADRGGLVVDDLIRAAQSFAASAARREFESQSQPLRRLADAARRVRRIAFEMSYFVRWHADTALVGVADDAVVARIDPLLQQINDFERNFDGLRGQRLPAHVDIAKPERDISEAYLELRRYLDQHISSVCDENKPADMHARAVLQAKALLAGPLPTAEDRLRLARVMTDFDLSAEPTREQVLRVVVPQLDDLDRRQTVEHQLHLEQSNIRLHDPGWTMLALPRELDGPSGGLAEVGRTLREIYRRTAQEMLATGAPPSIRLPLVDGRDAQQVGWRDDLVPRLGVEPPNIKPTLVISLGDGPSLLELSEGKPQTITVSVSSQRPATTPGRLTYSYDPRIELRPLDGARFQLNRPLRFQVLSKPRNSDVRQQLKPIVFTASLAGYAEARQELGAWLAGPDRVELVVRQINRIREAPGKHGILLRTLPNRATPFQFAVRNLSAEPKTVVATLYQIPLSLAGRLPPGRLFSRQGRVLPIVESSTFLGNQLRSELSVVAASRPVTLPPESEPMPLDFTSAPPAEPATDPEASSGPEGNNGATNEPPPMQDQKIDVSQGLLCQIKQQDPGGGIWHTWVELRTLPPRDYLRTTAKYDLSKLDIVCSLRQGINVPALASKAIPIEWDMTPIADDILRSMGNVIHTDAIKSRADPAELIRADVTALEGQTATVRLTVDGYPRALAFDVKLDEPNVYREPRRDLHAIQIVSIGMPGHPTKYFTSDLYVPAELEEGVQVRVLRGNDNAAFPVAKGNRQLELGFHVDAPVIAFGRDSGDKVTLRIDTPGFDPIALFGDRDSRYVVDKAGADGVVRIHNSVNDYVEAIDLPAVKGTYQLIVELETSGQYRSSSVELSFDDAPPRLTLFAVPERVPAGSQLPLSMAIKDDSGVDIVEYAIVDEPFAEPPEMTRIGLPIEDAVLIPTDDLKLDKEYYVKLRLTDRAGNELITDGTQGTPPPQVFSIFQPETPATGVADGVTPGTVRGRVALGAFGPPRIKVELTGGKRFSPFVTKNGGRFEFKDVPPGDYLLKASGNPLNRGQHVGEAEVSIKQQEDFTQPVIIDLEPKKD